MSINPMLFRRFKVREFERGLLFNDGEFKGVLRPGVYWRFDPLCKLGVAISSLRDPWLRNEKLDVIVRSGALGDEVTVLDLVDGQRALVWVDGRLKAILSRDLFALWNVFCKVEVEIVDAKQVKFEHAKMEQVIRSIGSGKLLQLEPIEAGMVGLYFRNGRFVEQLAPGLHAFWKDEAQVKVVPVDLREQSFDVGGQDIMTADNVTLRLNAVATFRVTDPLKTVTETGNVEGALYREVQFALRETVGGRDLESLLSGKEAVAREIQAAVRDWAVTHGLALLSVNIRDVILPGEMKTLLNQVTEARKAAEANLIQRREETAAMRSQANTAKLLENNPMLVRMRELELLEKLAANTKLEVVLGDQGLRDRIVKMI